MRVNDVLVAAREPDQRDAAALGDADRQRRRRRDGDDDRDARRGGLLHHLEARAAGDQRVARGRIELPARTSAPITLSSALWRPTSSRTSLMPLPGTTQAAA